MKLTCVNDDAACAAVPASGSTASDKKSYSENIEVSETCTYAAGAYCVKVDICEKYDVKDATDEAAACATSKDNAGTQNKCDKCVKLDSCDKYEGSVTAALGPRSTKEVEQCKGVKSSLGYPFMKDSDKKCKAQACTDNDARATDCANNAANCLHYSNKFIFQNTCANYTPQGGDDAAQQRWYEGVQNSSGDLCGWDSGTKKYKDRACGDKSVYTDFDCSSYLKSCKTNGTTCVATSTVCTSFNDSTDFCNYLLDPKGKDKCRPIAVATTSSSACTNKLCYDNVTATSDSDCEAYLSGCLTRGTGCIPNNADCTSYRGTKLQCEQFKQISSYDKDKNPIYVYCSCDAGNTATSKCKARTCADNTIAISNTECNGYLNDCITKGEGCVDKTSQCTVFKGDQATCAKFMGNSGKDYCWNTSTAFATASCAKKKCSDISGKNNKDCNDGMPPFKQTDAPFCVFDGTSCIDYDKNCSGFNGTEETCATFLAKDGPCKATTVGTIKGACAKRVCTEALNTLTTDADCQKYHPSCYTTGYGCSSIMQIKTITACNGGGLENNKSAVCAFTPTGTDKVNGTCKAFSACADAIKDKLACTTNSSCRWTENSTGYSCASHTCDTFAVGTDCQPIQSFDGTSSTVCVLQSGKCATADPGTMTDPKICYTKSAYTYSWNAVLEM